jgi:Asp-tRNA(Asn)/Glu-tRNA(Gln) amidotransferase B subunit
MGGRVVGAVMKKHKGLVEAATVKKLVDEELG